MCVHAPLVALSPLAKGIQLTPVKTMFCELALEDLCCLTFWTDSLHCTMYTTKQHEHKDTKWGMRIETK